MDVEKPLRDSQESKAKGSAKTNKVMTRLEDLQEDVEKISQEKSNLERELKIKERECELLSELLSEMQEKDAYNQVLQKKIDKKKKKIKILKEELERKEIELQSAVQEVQTIQEALLQAQQEQKKQHAAEPPRITTHPQDMRDAVPGEPVTFTTEATGTEPLQYQWEWKPTQEEGEWQLCDVERFPGADSSTIVISSVEKSNEGSYHCVVSNCAGSQTSNPAKLSFGECTTEILTERCNAKMLLHSEY